MRKVSCAVFFLFLVSPVFAFAESASETRYGTAADCKENVQAKGTFQYPTGVDEKTLGIIVDPKFNDKMKQERNTPDLQVTPIYDLVVEAVPAFSSCYTDTPEKFSTEPPKQLSFPVSIKLGTQTLVGPGVLKQSDRKSDDGRLLYEWKIPGWKNGIVSETKMERLITAIAKNDPSLQIVIEVKRKDGTVDSVKKGAEFGLCAPVWGNGAHQVVYDRVAHRLSDFIYQADSIVSVAFLKVDPFKAYQKEFTHGFNLRNYQGKSWFNIHLAAREGQLTIAQDCGNDKASHISISPLVPLGGFAFALASGRFIQIASDVTKRVLDFNAQNIHGKYLFNLPFPLIALHEFGHSFAKLKDEYLFFPKGITGASDKNCSTKPTTEFVYNNIRYGDSNFEGCRYTDGSYRPSQASLMRGAQSGETRFNVVSCGYIIAAIKGGTGPEYWQECMNPQWNTIKPISKTASLGTLFASLFQAFPLNKDFAAAGSAGERGQEILIEHISEDGTFTGEVISVPSISYSQPPLVDLDNEESVETAPPSNISDVTDDSIFDTVSVDLKVNGQDGPIEVEKRDRIVLSWISEGATRCRGVWSKNDIKLSGTAAGRITRPVTIKIACIDGEGNRADDAVRVDVTE